MPISGFRWFFFQWELHLLGIICISFRIIHSFLPEKKRKMWNWICVVVVAFHDDTPTCHDDTHLKSIEKVFTTMIHKRNFFNVQKFSMRFDWVYCSIMRPRNWQKFQNRTIFNWHNVKLLCFNYWSVMVADRLLLSSRQHTKNLFFLS
mgnify:CR=1 FL=1